MYLISIAHLVIVEFLINELLNSQDLKCKLRSNVIKIHTFELISHFMIHLYANIRLCLWIIIIQIVML